MEQMQSALLELLDPCGYHSSIPILHSTPAAMELCQRYARRAHGVKPEHTVSTSARVKAAVGQAASPGARKLLGQVGSHQRADGLHLQSRLNALGSAHLLTRQQGR